MIFNVKMEVVFCVLQNGLKEDKKGGQRVYWEAVTLFQVRDGVGLDLGCGKN